MIKKTELNITGMSCQHCVRAVEQALKGVSGVEVVDVSLAEHKAIVLGEADGTALIQAVTEEGYGANLT